ncbi:MAG TPA: C/D box methylation guide ribonucleoprotein complex aNOP56 subunit, partial [Thermoprotei archaeon]|nr:C/D box methylation guide ribonucleoprotein complex aNOP56 subunit [Thermoprotei archaeon]
LNILVQNLVEKRGVNHIIVENNDLAASLRKRFENVTVEYIFPSKGGDSFRENIYDYLSAIGINKEKYLEFLLNISLSLTKMKVKKAVERRDLYIAQSISSLDEIDKIINLCVSRLKEWYGLHFPELSDIIRDNYTYVNIVKNIGLRKDMNKEKLIEMGISEKKAEKICEKAKESMGTEFVQFDFQPILSLAENITKLYSLRKILEKYIDEAMKVVAPNLRGLVGPLLGARLIALAGGLNKLAMLPASTIQVLGAEKALFRALRTGGRPPKHGVIFQYPSIFRAPKWQRGKIARTLAAKIAIAARIDAFSGEYKVDEILEELNKRIEEVKTLYASPPPRKIDKKVKKYKGKRKKRGKRR